MVRHEPAVRPHSCPSVPALNGISVLLSLKKTTASLSCFYKLFKGTFSNVILKNKMLFQLSHHGLVDFFV